MSCFRGYHYGRNGFLRCHYHASPVNVVSGIATSCNTFFAVTYRRFVEKYKTPQEGIDNWNRHLSSFGLGNFLGYDLPTGRRGFIPNSEFYNRAYPNHRWFTTATISNAIGQEKYHDAHSDGKYDCHYRKQRLVLYTAYS